MGVWAEDSMRLEGKGLATWELGGIMGQHQRKPLQPDHRMPTWVTQCGFDKGKLCFGVARILFWRLEMLLGMSPLRDSWFPWKCSHHCQCWKGLRESPCAATTGELASTWWWQPGLFQSQMGHVSSPSKATQATRGQQDAV